MRCRTIVLLCAVLLFPMGSAQAHPLDVTFTTATIRDSLVETEMRLTARQAAVAFLERESDVTPSDIGQVESRLLAAYNDDFSWKQGGETCSRKEQGMDYNRERTAELLLNGIVIRTTYECPNPGGTLELVNAVFTEDFPEQRNIFSLTGDPTQTQHVFTPRRTKALLDVDSRSVTFSVEAPRHEGLLANVGRFVWLGVEHVAIGFDHILFMVGIYLVARKPKELLKVITSFTIAHSVTLILATLGIIRLTTAPVEAAIAATIVYIGVENIVRKNVHHRALITFGLGLVHGLGFSAVLREIGIPKQYLLPDLIGFNIGVELGQLAIVVVLLPIVWAISRRPRLDRAVVYTVSMLISVIGLVWFVQRIGWW